MFREMLESLSMYICDNVNSWNDCGMLNAMFKTSFGLFGCVFVFGFCLSIFVKQPRQDIGVAVTSYIVVGLSIFASIFCIAILPLIFPPLWI